MIITYYIFNLGVRQFSIIMTQYQIGQEQTENYTHQYNLFSMLPKREISNLSDSQLNSNMLISLLTCKICLSVLNTPIYLRCSHRFCKDCIEKYLRKGFNKCCPICRQTLLSRRQARIDHSMIQFINLFRHFSHIEEENKYFNQQSISSVSTNQSRNSQSIETSWKQYKTTLEKTNMKSYKKDCLNQLQAKQNIKKESIKKSKMIQVNQGQNDETLQIITISNGTQQELELQIISCSSDKQYFPYVLQEEESEYQSSENQQVQQKHQYESNSLINTSALSPNSDDCQKKGQREQINIICISNSTSDKSYCGLETQYFSCAADIENKCKRTNNNAYLQIILQPYPNKIVPNLQKSNILCPFDMQINTIRKAIAAQVNMLVEKVKLYIMCEIGIEQICSNIKLCDLNDKFWHENHYKVGTLSLIIRHLQKINKNRVETKRILYYFIKF